MSAIFVHAWWRSSSTYVWSKLRRDPSLRCYYEPLHERLATLDRAAIEGSAEAGMSRLLRHPVPEENYFAEYLDLVASGRLRYARELAYARYLLRPDERDEALHAYLDRLIRAAASDQRTPALCFCRSQMRSVWMRRALGGNHVAQIRNPFDQWASFQVNPYFVRQMLVIALALRARHPLAFAHVEWFERQAVALANRNSSPADRGSRPVPDRHGALRVFLVLWMASTLQALSCCDLVLDVDRLAADRDYQQEASRWFATRGCVVDFTDCRTPGTHGSPNDADVRRTMVAQAAAAIRSNAAGLVVADETAVARHLPSLAASSRSALEEVLPPGRT